MSTLFGKTEDHFLHIFNLIGADLYCNWLTDVKYLVLGIFICGNFAWILLYGHLSRDAILRIRQHFTTFSITSIIMYVFFMSHDKVIKCINSRTYFRLVSIIDINHFSGTICFVDSATSKSQCPRVVSVFSYLISEMGQSQTIKLNWFLLGYIHQAKRNIWGQWGSVPSYFWQIH